MVGVKDELTVVVKDPLILLLTLEEEEIDPDIESLSVLGEEETLMLPDDETLGLLLPDR